MIFLPNKIKKQRSGKAFWSGVVIVLILILTIFNNSVRYYVSVPLVAIARPFLSLGESFGSWDGLFNQKGELIDENLALKEKIEELEVRMLSMKILEKENEDFKKLLSRDTDRNYLMTAVLSRPPQNPYDVLTIDAGGEQGVEIGMMVTAYGDVLLGYVSEVFDSTSKIKLISFPKEETNVTFVGNGLSVIATGIGGENFEIVLPRSIEINSGELITTLGMNPLLVGIVERVEIELTDPFQKIFLRLPINIQELKYVMVGKK